MSFRLYIVLLIATTSVAGYSQEDKRKEVSFFSNSEFEWEKWECKISDSSKIKVIDNLKNDLRDNSMMRDINSSDDNFHIIDVNSDGQKDVIYYGFAGSEKNSIILFIYENGKYVEKINTYGEIIEINRELDYLPMTFKILNSPCCEDVVYGFEEYNYFVESDKIFYNNSINIKFLRNTFFPILDDNHKYILFETTSEKYNLRNSPKIINGDNDNIVSVYPKGSFGTAIYSKKDKENENRIWWFVIMRNNKDVLSTNLYDENNSSYYSIGWMSSKTLLKK
jgi:hypothetical protein